MDKTIKIALVLIISLLVRIALGVGVNIEDSELDYIAEVKGYLGFKDTPLS